MSAPKAFLDTNVFLYVLSSDDRKADRAETLIARGPFISVQVLNEFVAVVSRKIGMPFAEIRDVLTTIRRLCTVTDVDVETHDLGLDLADRYHISWYDALIVAAAVRFQCAILYTEDMQNGMRIAGLRIENPF